MSTPKPWRAPAFAVLLTTVGLLTASCTASRQPVGSAAEQKVPNGPGPTTTVALSNNAQKPVWPAFTVAQRTFAGEQMFVEDRDGRWAAWVMSEPEAGHSEALEFFSGERMLIVIEQGPGPGKTFMFTDKKGRTHAWNSGSSFLTDDAGNDNGGAMYFGDENNFLDFRDSIYAEGLQGDCPLELTVVSHRLSNKDASSQSNHAWTKIPMYLEPPSKDCPKGRWVSDIRSALNLGDGTFLLALGEYVFRLRMSDLSPVGEARILRIASAQQVKSAVDKINAEKIEDPNAYLSSTLGFDRD